VATVAAAAAAVSTSAPGATAGEVVSACLESESDFASEELSANGIGASVGCGAVSLSVPVAPENTSMQLEQLRLLVYVHICQSRDEVQPTASRSTHENVYPYTMAAYWIEETKISSMQLDKRVSVWRLSKLLGNVHEAAT
jgi:hypothetical protein